MTSENYSKVLKTLAQNKAMSLVEPMSVLEAPDSEIEAIVNDLKQRNLVKISEEGTLDEIVTIREQGLRAAG